MKNNKTLRCEPGDCGRSNLPNFTENDLLLRGGAKKGSNGRANSIHMMDDADVSGELKLKRRVRISHVVNSPSLFQI